MSPARPVVGNGRGVWRKRKAAALEMIDGREVAEDKPSSEWQNLEEEAKEERRESQRVRWQHSPTDSYDGQLWQDWMESRGLAEPVYEEESEGKGCLGTSERKADSNADAAAGGKYSVLSNGVLLERQ